MTGDFLPDHAMTPVLVADATPAMRLLQADVFAPVLALVPVMTMTPWLPRRPAPMRSAPRCLARTRQRGPWRSACGLAWCW